MLASERYHEHEQAREVRQKLLSRAVLCGQQVERDIEIAVDEEMELFEFVVKRRVHRQIAANQWRQLVALDDEVLPGEVAQNIASPVQFEESERQQRVGRSGADPIRINRPKPVVQNWKGDC